MMVQIGLVPAGRRGSRMQHWGLRNSQRQGRLGMRWDVVRSIGWARWALLLWPLLIAATVSAADDEAPEAVSQSASAEPLRVQLMWSHQAEFAGLYVAELRRHFAEEGLDVELIEGGPQVDSIAEVQAGNADIAVAWLDAAMDRQDPSRPVVNVAQIFEGSALLLLCRLSAGVYSPADLAGRSIGVWGLGDEQAVRAVLRALAIPVDSVKLIRQRPDGLDLSDGTLPCVTALSFNEYWQILGNGVPAQDLLTIRPAAFGVSHVENGLYVLESRLQDTAFRDQLVRFLRALRLGWEEAQAAPTLAVEVVKHFAPQLDPAHQRLMFETVSKLVPADGRFGLLDLDRYDAVVQMRLRDGELEPEVPVWTHSIWNAMRQQDDQAGFLTAATDHYADRLVEHPAFQLFVLLGVLTFALSGVLEAVNRGYDFWGRLILAVLSGLGAGTLRDLLIGAERLPLFYVQQPVFPLSILALVALTSLVVVLFRDIAETRLFKRVKTSSDIIGFAVLALVGAQVAVAADMPWFWVPVCAALTCAGGGMLRDVVINREPRTFQGEIYEEAAIVGALVFVAGLALANQFEHSPLPVYLSAAAAILVVLLIRVLVQFFGLRYPSVFFGPIRRG